MVPLTGIVGPPKYRNSAALTKQSKDGLPLPEVGDHLGPQYPDGLHCLFPLIQGATEQHVVDPQALNVLQVSNTLARPADNKRLGKLLGRKATISLLVQLLRFSLGRPGALSQMSVPS